METDTARLSKLNSVNGSLSGDQKIRDIKDARASLIHQIVSEGLGGEGDFASDYSVEKEFGKRHDAVITVITRTQGNRTDLLLETFLCLSAQTDRRFRLVLVEHKVSDSGKKLILSLVNSLPEWLKDRTKIVSTNSGGRAHPLNIGFLVADSDYAVILDDDDLVFDNWIEAFVKGAETDFGKIIHTGTYTQQWERGCSERGSYYRAVGSPEPGYCDRFDYLEQLNCNYCPTMGLAYPLFVFRSFGVYFDESLNTVEDWDFLMRSVRICGVRDIDERTAIYRLWASGESSSSLHNELEWEVNRQLVQEKLDEMPLVFPSGYYRRIAERFDVHQDIRFDAHEIKAYIVKSGGESEAVKPEAAGYSVSSQLNFLEFNFGNVEIKEIGIDLRAKGQMTLSELKMCIDCANGKRLEFDMYDLCGNYYCYSDDKMGFIAARPHFKVVFPSLLVVESCRLTFKYRNYVEEALLTGTKLRLRAKRKAKRLVGKLSGRIG